MTPTPGSHYIQADFLCGKLQDYFNIYISSAVNHGHIAILDTRYLKITSPPQPPTTTKLKQRQAYLNAAIPHPFQGLGPFHRNQCHRRPPQMHSFVYSMRRQPQQIALPMNKTKYDHNECFPKC